MINEVGPKEQINRMSSEAAQRQNIFLLEPRPSEKLISQYISDKKTENHSTVNWVFKHKRKSHHKKMNHQ